MRPTPLAQPRRAALQHQPLRHAHPPQRRDIHVRHHPGIHMRQQPGLAQHQRTNMRQIRNRAGKPEHRQRFPRRPIPQLRLIPKREQRLPASRRGTRPRDRHHFLGRQIRLCHLSWRLRKGAISAGISAQPCQRNKHFPRVAHHRPMAASRIVTRFRQQCREGPPIICREKLDRLGRHLIQINQQVRATQSSPIRFIGHPRPLLEGKWTLATRV